MTLQLKNIEPFAQGGNRLCFVHPEASDRCIKVRRPDFTLADCRRKKGFPKSLRPLSSFDDSLEEFKVMKSFEQRYGDIVFKHISRCFGFVETDMGKGLVSELIRNTDGRISITLKQYLWDYGLTEQIEVVIADFINFWRSETIPSRDLLLHNIVVQMADSKVNRLVVIDGLGSAGFIPFWLMSPKARKKKVLKKTSNFKERIQSFLEQRKGSDFPGYHGLLFHDGVQNGITDTDESLKTSIQKKESHD